MLNRSLVSAGIVVLCVASALALQGSKESRSGQVVDAGSFGVFVNGVRVATETFTITQRGDGSVLASELRVQSARGELREASELQLAANGDIIRYHWKEVSPGKAEATVEPKDLFLTSRLSAGPTDKPIETPFLMPHSSVILDDYFFAHRQLLAWRYLAGGCRPSGGQLECQLVRTQFGAVIPRQRTSVSVYMEYLGNDKVSIGGAERDFKRFKLASDGQEWTMWLDENNRLMRIMIAGHNTEVLRD